LSDAIFTRLLIEPELEKRRAIYAEKLQRKRVKLKKARMKYLAIKADELTGQPITEREAQFSHVMAVSLFPEFALEVWNGLIIDRTLHAQLTARGVLDDNDLLRECEQRQWNTDWHPEFAWQLARHRSRPTPRVKVMPDAPIA
jgi:hypothetical protein